MDEEQLMAEEVVVATHRTDLSDDGRLNLFLQSVVSHAVVMLDPHGGIISWNAGAQHSEGYAAEEILGQNFCLLFTQEDCRQGVPNKALRMARSTGRFETDAWRVRKDGNRFWAHVTIDAVKNDADEVIGFVEISQAITAK